MSITSLVQQFMTMSQIDSCLSMGAIYFRREVFLPYKHREWVEGCKPHPGNIVEPASLAVIEALSGSQYDVASSLPPAAIKEGRLSSLQLESIIKAVSTSSFTSSILSLHLTFPSSFAVSLSLLFLLLLSPSLLFLIYLNLSVYLSLSSSISISLSVSPFPPLSLLVSPGRVLESYTVITLLLPQAHRHQKVLPNGERAGFFIGDAAGVGKGRQVNYSSVVIHHASRLSASAHRCGLKIIDYCR